MKLTPEQREIMWLVNAKGGTITKKEVVEDLDTYYRNGEKHIGERLSRMVNAGLLIRVKPGVFRINAMRKAGAKPSTIIENQETLFGNE